MSLSHGPKTRLYVVRLNAINMVVFSVGQRRLLALISPSQWCYIRTSMKSCEIVTYGEIK